MSEIKHTPGPWHWDSDPCNYDPYQDAPWLVSEDGTAVIRGEIHVSNPFDRDMLGACADMLNALETVLAGGHLNTGEQAIVANAIAKATGRNVVDVVKGE